MTREPVRVLGVLLAGGANSRFGSHKALAVVGGRTIADRGLDSLRAATTRLAIVANDPDPYRFAGLPIRPDARPGLGALGGVLSAVRWARDEGCDAALVLACDMPFVPGALMRHLAREAARDAVCAPWSPGPRGVEPLCAAYGAEVEPAIDGALRRGERAVISFWREVRVRILPEEVVRGIGDPRRVFWNVNRPGDLREAESWLSGSRRDGAGTDDTPADTERRANGT